MRKQVTLLMICLLAVIAGTKAQKFEEALKRTTEQLPAEKICLQPDRDNYVAGETIWFKAYLLHNGKPGGLSSNLFVQLVNEQGKAAGTYRYPVTGAVAKGSIYLPDSLPQGNYFLRALTANMLNNDEAQIYKKVIPVFRQGGAPVVAGTQNLAVQFFPESGQLIDGILSVVAFKATDPRGAPVEVSGTIKTADGTTIASFSSYHDGIGKVQFKPQAGKKYVAEIATGAGLKIFSLPEVQSGGISLKVNDEKGGKKFQLSRGEANKQYFDIVTVVARINNQVVYENEVAFEDYPSVVGHILTDSLPSGVLDFTVFDKEGKPAASRLSFVNNGGYSSPVTINVTKTGTGKRQENDIELAFTDAVQRSLSIAVTAWPGLDLGDNSSNLSSYLLTSELENYVHNPAWYFSGPADSVKTATDNLLLTQQKAGPGWEKILANQAGTQKFSDPDFIALSGTVVDPKTKTPLANGKLNILLEAQDSTQQSFETTVDAKGRFSMDSLYFNGKSKLFYAYSDAKEKPRPALVLADSDELSAAAVIIPAGFSKGSMTWELKSMQNNREINDRFMYAQAGLEAVKELERVTLEARRKKTPYEEVNEKLTTGVFRADGKENIDNINNPVNDKSMNAVDFVKNRIQQLEIQGGGFVNRKNVSLMTGQKWAVGIFIDEEPSNLSLLRVFRAQDIALVKFYEAGFVGVGSSFPGGAVAIYTKTKMKDEQKPDKLEFFEQTGYSACKEFYSPDYEKADASKVTADNRATLYWNPDIITDADNKTVKLKFFNNDSSKKFKIVLEGFDANGRLIHEEKIIGNQ